MTVKIPISADVTSVGAGLDKMEAGAKKVNKAVDQVGTTARKAAKGLDDMVNATKRAEEAAKRLLNIQQTLAKETGSHVGSSAAQKFIENFDRMRADHFLTGGGKIRRHPSFESWYASNDRMFVNPNQASNYRRRIIQMGLSGTGVNYAPPPGAGGGGAGGGGGGGGGRGGFLNSIPGGSMAFSFLKGGLALAGIQGVLGMASKAVDLNTQEATTGDSIKRSLGDLGISFDDLRDRVRMTGEGLGIAYVESMKMAQSFARASNATSDVTVAQGVRVAGGFARAYGLDPGATAGMFGQMRLMRGGGDDRRFASLMAEAIAKGGTSAKADEVLQAIQGFMTSQARLTLGPANAAGYAGMLAGFTRSGYAGLDVGGASSIINTANSAISRGGGVGEASMNFLYTALATPGMNPVQAQALMSGGMFASSASMFGKGSIMGDWARKNGAPLPGMSNVTNIQAIMGRLRGMYGGGEMNYYRLNALQNLMGLGSIQHAAALELIGPESMGGLDSMLSKAGIDISGVNVSGIQTLGKLSAAKGIGGLRSIGQQIGMRSDLTAGQRMLLGNAMGGTSEDQMRSDLTRLVATLDREKTTGSETLEAIKSINDALTKGGGPLLDGVNKIKDAVGAMASVLAPNTRVGQEFAKAESDAKIDANRSATTAVRDSVKMSKLGGDGYDWRLADKLGVSDMTLAIRNQERSGPMSISPPNKKGVSAYGIMQITRGTFDDYKLPGERFENEQDRINSAIRKIAADMAYYRGDRRKVAAAYIGGRGAVKPDGTIANVKDVLGTSAAGYADSAVTDMDRAAGGGGGTTKQIASEVTVHLKYPGGQTAADPVTVRHSFPVAAGNQ